MTNGKRHFGLRIRFTLLVSALLLLTFAVIAYFLVRNTQSNDIRNINLDSKSFSNLATPQIGNTYSIYGSSGSIVVGQQIQSFTDLDSDIINVAVVSLNGQPLYQSHPGPQLHSFNQNNNFDTQYVKESNGLISQIMVPYLSTSGEHPYSIVYVVNTAVLAADTQRQIKDIILFSLIGLAITAVVMYELIYRFYVKPIEFMSRQAITISQGDYDSSVDASRKDEIGDLAESVNTMSNKLKANIKALQEVDRLKSEFITITSHNLRTPLTIIQGNFELLNSSQLPTEIAKPLHSIQETSSQLAGFAEDMLTISTIEAGEGYVDKTPTTIEALLVPIRNRFSPMAATKKVGLDWRIVAPETTVKLSVNYTRNILRGLIDNAIKFTKEGGSVICQIAIENNSLKIVVSDTGIGISPEEQSKLFTKFHRGTSTMEYDYQGTGIGLYVTKLMVEAQKGSITVSSELAKGSIFTVLLPL